LRDQQREHKPGIGQRVMVGGGGGEHRYIPRATGPTCSSSDNSFTLCVRVSLSSCSTRQFCSSICNALAELLSLDWMGGGAGGGGRDHTRTTAFSNHMMMALMLEMLVVLWWVSCWCWKC
jgi:hypothetical protein